MAWTAQGTGHALPASCWALLEHLHAGGAMRVSDIAACHGVEMPSITPRLQMLEGAGLVLRRRDPRDRRASVIEISPGGRDALEGLHRARLALFSRALTPADMAQLPKVTEVLERVAQALQTSLDAAAPGQSNEVEK